MTDSDLETEATSPYDTTTFEHFGRTWTVPTKRHHKHLVQVKQIARREGSVDADDIALVYLSDEEYDTLLELDVTYDELGGFANAIAKAMGVGDAGNS
jgi:hypothetical protein